MQYEIVVVSLVAGLVLGKAAADARRASSVRGVLGVAAVYLVAVVGLAAWSGWDVQPWVLPLTGAFLIVFLLSSRTPKAPPGPQD